MTGAEAREKVHAGMHLKDSRGTLGFVEAVLRNRAEVKWMGAARTVGLYFETQDWDGVTIVREPSLSDESRTLRISINGETEAEGLVKAVPEADEVNEYNAQGWWLTAPMNIEDISANNIYDAAIEGLRRMKEEDAKLGPLVEMEGTDIRIRVWRTYGK